MFAYACLRHCINSILLSHEHCRLVAGERWGDVLYLLGEWGKRKEASSVKLLDREKDKWKPNLTVVKASAQYLQETGRLTYQPEEGQVG